MAQQQTRPGQIHTASHLKLGGSAHQASQIVREDPLVQAGVASCSPTTRPERGRRKTISVGAADAQLVVVDCDLEFQAATGETKRGVIELRWAEMALCVVGGSRAFTGNAHKVSVQFAVGVFVVEHGNRISARLHASEVADAATARGR